MGEADDVEAKRARWLADLAAVPTAVGYDDAGVLVIDTVTGRIVGSSPGAAELLGRPVPARVEELVPTGVVARPDLGALRKRIDRWRAEAEGSSTEVANTWTGDLRVHPPGGPARLVRLDVVHHLRPRFEAEALTVVLRPAGTGGEEPGDEPSGDWSTWDLYDFDMRAIALDPASPSHGVVNQARFGVPVAGLVVPEDLRRVLGAAAEVTQGAGLVAHYSTDFPRRGCGPLRMDHTLRLVAGSGPVGSSGRRYLTINRPARQLRTSILRSMLTERQAVAVRAVFAGRRAQQIAQEQGVEVSTIRSHLADAYRALGVSGRDELVARYHPPGLDRDPVTVAVADPDGTLRLSPGPPGREPSTERRTLEGPDGPIEVALTTWLAPEGQRAIPAGLLSKKEVEVVSLLFDGLRAVAIAERRGVGVPTVRKQLSSAFAKLEVDGQAELTSTYRRPTIG